MNNQQDIIDTIKSHLNINAKHQYYDYYVAECSHADINVLMNSKCSRSFDSGFSFVSYGERFAILKNYKTVAKLYGADKKPHYDENTIEYRSLPDMYDSLYRIDVKNVRKDESDFFRFLEIRTGSFIGNLTSERILMAKVMKDDFDKFYEKVKPELEKDAETWHDICYLKEQWDDFQKIFDNKEFEAEIEIEKEPTNIKMEKRKKFTMSNVVRVDFFNIVSYDDPFKTLKRPLFAIVNNCGMEKSSTLSMQNSAARLSHLIDEMNNEMHFPFSKVSKDPFIEHENQFTPLFKKMEKNSVITGTESLINLTRNSDSFRPMKIKIHDDFLHLEIVKSQDDRISNNFIEVLKKIRRDIESRAESSTSSSSSSSNSASLSSSSSYFTSDNEESIEEEIKLICDEYLHKFQKCPDSETLLKLHLSLKKNIQQFHHFKCHHSIELNIGLSAISSVEIYQCRKREVILDNQKRVNVYFTTQIDAFKNQQRSSSTVDKKQSYHEPVGYFYAKNNEENLEMCLGYMISGIKYIRIFSTSRPYFTDIPLPQFMEQSLKTEAKKAESIIDNRLKQILMYYNKTGKKELCISNPKDFENSLLMQT